MRNRSPAPFIPKSVTADLAGQWVAIYRRQLVDHDFDADRLFERLDKRGIGDKALTFNVPRPGVVWV